MGAGHIKLQKKDNAKQKKIEQEQEAQVATALYRDTIATIQIAWSSMKERENIEAETASKIYKKLFSDHPEYRRLFDENVGLLVRRLLMMMGTVVENLDDLARLRKRITALGKRHARYGVPADAYQDFLDSIIHAMKQTMGDEFTPRVQYCFTVMFMWASNIMIESGRPVKQERKAYDVDTIDFLQDYGSFLEDPTCLEYFHLYLSSEFSEENILFYIEVMKYKNTEVSISEMDKKLKEYSSVIYNKYICPNAPTQINLPHDISNNIKLGMEKPTPAIFDTAVEEVKKLMIANKWHSFLGSKSCQALCAAKDGKIEHIPNSMYSISDVHEARSMSDLDIHYSYSGEDSGVSFKVMI